MTNAQKQICAVIVLRCNCPVDGRIEGSDIGFGILPQLTDKGNGDRLQTLDAHLGKGQLRSMGVERWPPAYHFRPQSAVGNVGLLIRLGWDAKMFTKGVCKRFVRMVTKTEGHIDHGESCNFRRNAACSSRNRCTYCLTVSPTVARKRR